MYILHCTVFGLQKHEMSRGAVAADVSGAAKTPVWQQEPQDIEILSSLVSCCLICCAQRSLKKCRQAKLEYKINQHCCLN